MSRDKDHNSLAASRQIYLNVREQEAAEEEEGEQSKSDRVRGDWSRQKTNIPSRLHRKNIVNSYHGEGMSSGRLIRAAARLPGPGQVGCDDEMRTRSDKHHTICGLVMMISEKLAE